MGILGEELRKANQELPIIVGGSALEIYTAGDYRSHDIDIFSDYEQTISILKEMGFVNTSPSLYYLEEFDILIDWLGSVLNEGMDAHDRTIFISTPAGNIRIVSPADLIVDRLSTFELWKDRASGEWARTLLSLVGSGTLPCNKELLVKLMRNAGLKQDALDRLPEIELESQSEDSDISDEDDYPCPR